MVGFQSLGIPFLSNELQFCIYFSDSLSREWTKFVVFSNRFFAFLTFFNLYSLNVKIYLHKNGETNGPFNLEEVREKVQNKAFSNNNLHYSSMSSELFTLAKSIKD
jgi:hypothetical protein